MAFSIISPTGSNGNTDLSDPQKLLLGLGKSTKRGIKKCLNCGIYNGARSITCKNKQCGIVLKDREEKSKVDFDAVKLFTTTEKQLYSVRVKDMGPDSRGFVQLPLLQSSTKDEANMFSEVALCFVDSCQNSFDNSILKCHEEDQNDFNMLCVHIRSALKSQSTAFPLVLKKDILHTLNISNDCKETLYATASEKEGYLVQRVSKSVMAIKCQVSPKHPLGYLHFTFLTSVNGESYEECFCSCERYSGPDAVEVSYSSPKKCIHYYACIWAIASDNKYYSEFSHFIHKEVSLVMSECILLNNMKNTKDSSLNTQKRMPHAEGYQNKNKLNQSIKNINKVKKSKKKLLTRKHAQIIPKIFPIEIKVINECNSSKDEEDVNWKFVDWLSYVTDSINRTMQFDNYGIVNTLTFSIPENFFLYFSRKIPSLYKPINTDVSVSYSIMNILHLKGIFDSPQVKLKLSKKFVHNDQKGYIEYNENEEYNDTYMCSFIFFLNVGQSTVDESDDANNAFVIEWMPISTVVTKVGELKLHYKYGRKST